MFSLFQVSIYMPHMKTLRNIIDRMKNLSNFVTLSANQEGDMNLCVETDLFSVATHFKELEHPRWSKYIHMCICIQYYFVFSTLFD